MNKPHQITMPERMGQNDKLYFRVTGITNYGVMLTDPTLDEGNPLVIAKSDSDWDDWGDDFEMPQPLFGMLFGVEPKVGMIVALYRA